MTDIENRRDEAGLPFLFVVKVLAAHGDSDVGFLTMFRVGKTIKQSLFFFICFVLAKFKSI